MISGSNWRLSFLVGIWGVVVLAVGLPENRTGWVCIAVFMAATVSSFFAVRTSAGRNIALSVVATLVTLLAIEIYLVFSAPEAERFSGDFWNLYYTSHDELGYGPNPAGRYRANKWLGDVEVYDVTYTINANGLRAIPNQPASAPCKVAFFGGSVTFGEGLDDEHAMPNKFVAASDGRYFGFNFGFHGYGPHQMARALESGLVADIVGPEIDLVIYQGIEGHVARAVGQVTWDMFGPRYAPSRDGDIAYRGPFRGENYRHVRSVLKDFAIFKFIERNFVASGRVRDQDINTYVAILDFARKIAAKEFDAEFVVLFWDKGSGSRYADQVMTRLSDGDFHVVRVSNVIPDIVQKNSRNRQYVLSDYDPHPSALAQDLIGSYLADTVAREACDAS
jgi:hypothetical protein